MQSTEYSHPGILDGRSKPMTHPKLSEARAQVSAGDAAAALPLAKTVLDEALEAGDFALQGHAMHCLAVLYLRLQGQFDLALEQAEHATLCFQRVEDVPGECAALATHAIAAVRLGRHERAMESALLAVRLSETLDDLPRKVLTYHALGVAAYSGRNFETSRNAYQRAIQLALQCDPPLNVFEMHVDLAFTECLLYFNERNFGGQRLSLDALARHVAEAQRLHAQDPGNISLSPGSHVNNLLVMQLSDLLLKIWQGDVVDFRDALRDYGETARRNNRPWLLATEAWCEAEIAIVEGDPDRAAACAARMIEIALASRHETLTGIAYQLACWIAQLRGDAEGALAALKDLMRREQAARAESLRSRVSVIEWQLALRQNQNEVRKLASETRLFERLAMEDALTGLPNRRALEAHLEQHYDASARAGHCLALLDVDRFKEVNDRHSHLVGDEVLKAVAGAFLRNVRQEDFCARLAGDEFVLLLRSTLPEAEQICARIRADVANGLPHRPDVKPSISIGLIGLDQQESVTAALARADAAMYAAKEIGKAS